MSSLTLEHCFIAHYGDVGIYIMEDSLGALNKESNHHQAFGKTVKDESIGEMSHEYDVK